MLITSLDYSSYVGRIAVGRLKRGILQAGMNVSLVKRDGSVTRSTIKELYTFEGLGKERTKKPVEAGDIIALMGIDDFEIGDTVADYENPEPPTRPSSARKANTSPRATCANASTRRPRRTSP